MSVGFGSFLAIESPSGPCCEKMLPARITSDYLNTIVMVRSRTESFEVMNGDLNIEPSPMSSKKRIVWHRITSLPTKMRHDSVGVVNEPGAFELPSQHLYANADGAEQR